MRVVDVSSERAPQDHVDTGSNERGPSKPATQVGLRGEAAVAFLVAAAAGLVASRPLSDNSFLTHLATGRVILAEGVPTRNPFLFTGTDFPVPSWWWSVLLAVTEELGSATAIRILVGVVAGVLGAVLVRTARPRPVPTEGARLLATVLPAGLALFCVFHFLSGRPHLAGYLLLALVVWVWNEERSPWWMVPIFSIWVNVHGSWLYGVVVLVMFGVARAIDDRCLRRRDPLGVGAAALGVVVGGALYPTTFEIVLLPTRQFGDPVEREALQAYTEWARVALDQPMLWALVALVAIALWGALRDRRFATAALVGALGVMGYSGARLVPIAAISLVPFAAMALRDLGSLRLPTGRAAQLTALAAVLIIAGTLVSCLVGPAYELDRFPVESVDWLEERGLVANEEVVVVSHDYVGNYLEWRYGTDANAFVDDRPDAQTLIDYRILFRLEDGWQEVLEGLDPQVVLWRTDAPLSDELLGDSDWVRAGQHGDFSVFCAAERSEACT